MRTKATSSMPARPVIERLAAVLAVALLATCFAMITFTFASLVLPGGDKLPDRPNILNVLAATSVFVALPSVGALLAIKRPGNPIGWLFLVCGAGFILGIFSTEYVGRVVIVGADLPAVSLVDWLGAWSMIIALSVAVLFIPLLFPDGHLPSPRWRPVATAASVLLVVGTLSAAIAAGPQGAARGVPAFITVEGPLADVATALVDLYFPVLIVLGVLSLASLVVRFRRSRGVERQQLKWFLLAVAFLVVAVVLATTTTVEVAWYAVMVGLAALPITAGLAILRYRLYEIDRIVSRSIAYALVTGVLVIVYLLVNLGLTTLFNSVTGGGSASVAVSTLVVAVLFTPLRRRAQRIVDRRFDRARYDAELITSAFSERLRDRVDLSGVTADLDGTVQSAVAPTSLGLWLRGGAR